MRLAPQWCESRGTTAAAIFSDFPSCCNKSNPRQVGCEPKVRIALGDECRPLVSSHMKELTEIKGS